MIACGLQHGERAEYIDVDERSRTGYGAVYVTFRREVNDAVWIIIGNHFAN